VSRRVGICSSEYITLLSAFTRVCMTYPFNQRVFSTRVPKFSPASLALFSEVRSKHLFNIHQTSRNYSLQSVYKLSWSFRLYFTFYAQPRERRMLIGPPHRPLLINLLPFACCLYKSSTYIITYLHAIRLSKHYKVPQKCFARSAWSLHPLAKWFTIRLMKICTSINGS
jgi:hypothetical protein